MFRLGSSEPLIPASDEERAYLRFIMSWRKPLSFDEVAQIAPTPDVRARPGRP